MADAGRRRSLWRVMLDAFRRRRPLDAAAAALDRFQEQMAAGGYVEWASVAPPRTDDPVECRRFEWTRAQFIRPARVHPADNVAGLYWRSHGPTIDAMAVADMPAPAANGAGEGET